MTTQRTLRTALAGLAVAAVTAVTCAAPAPVAAVTTAAGTTSAAALDASYGAQPTAALTTAPSYAFASLLAGQPVRWNPCAPIRWTANASRGPAGGLDVLKASVARVAALTGTTWQYVGPSTVVPTSSYLPRTSQTTYQPVLIGWADATSSDLLRGQSTSVLGMTRTAWFGVRSATGVTTAATRAAVIALDRTDRLPLRGGTSWNTVALHELGHAMGLGHVSDTRQLMASVLPRTATDLQAGDRLGLAKLGRAAGCVAVPQL